MKDKLFVKASKELVISSAQIAADYANSKPKIQKVYFPHEIKRYRAAGLWDEEKNCPKSTIG